MSLTSNVGTADRVVRLALGALLVALPFVLSSPFWDGAPARIGAPLVGLVLIATALVRFCPLYRLLGTNTCGVARH